MNDNAFSDGFFESSISVNLNLTSGGFVRFSNRHSNYIFKNLNFQNLTKPPEVKFKLTLIVIVVCKVVHIPGLLLVILGKIDLENSLLNLSLIHI